MIGVRDVFLWATLMGNDALADLLWNQCDKPVHTALLGALLCQRLAKKTPQGWAQNRLIARKKRMQVRLEPVGTAFHPHPHTHTARRRPMGFSCPAVHVKQVAPHGQCGTPRILTLRAISVYPREET